MRLDETANQIQALASAPATEIATRDDDLTKAMDRLEDARKAAWKAIRDAPRTDRTSSL